MYNLILSLMPWRDILTHGLKGWRKTKHTEYYDAYELEADPEIQVEVYVLDYIPPNDTKLYQYRLHSTHPFIPQILDMTTPQTSKEVFTRLILQHTPLRLDESKTLPNRPLEMLVAEVFLGFEAIFKLVGPMKVKQNMVGFDKKGVPKVWLNSNFAKNHMNPFDVLKAHRESIMVRNIFEIFEPYGYSLGKEASTFEQAKKVVLDKLANKTVEKTLLNVCWHPREYTKPTTPPIRTSKSNVSFQHSSFSQSSISNKSRDIREIIRISDKSLQLNAKLSNTKPFFDQQHGPLKAHHQTQIPTSIDETAVVEYLGNSVNTVDCKMMYISFLRQNDLSDRVNDICNVFEFSILRDPQLYSILMQIKGVFEKNNSFIFQAKIKRIKDIYNGTTPFDSLPSSEYPQEHRKQSINSDNQRTQTMPQSHTSQSHIDGMQKLQDSGNNRGSKASGASREDDLIQSFDKALQRFVSDKAKAKPSAPQHSTPQKPPPPQSWSTGLEKRATVNDRSEDVSKEMSIEEKMKIKQKSFAGLKEEAMRVLGL